MLYPTIQVQNFFKDPDKIVEYSKQLEFHYDEEGKWPGKRTDYLHKINNPFFGYLTRKIVSLIYPINYHDISWSAESTFQSIPADENTGEGWIHQDVFAEFTAIIYLSKHNNCGTSIYKKNNEHIFKDNNDIKKDYYLNKKPFDETYYKALKESNSNFTKIAEFNSCYNSCIIFDGHNYHGANQFYDDNYTEERLTLITFFHELIGRNIKYSGGELGRI